MHMPAAVYKYWAKDPQKEIVQVNIEGVRNVMEAAARQKVAKVVYVGTALALDASKVPIDESGWSGNRSEPYHHSKIEAEKLAFRLAEEYGISLVSVLPTAMIGPHFDALTPTMETLSKVQHNKIPFDPDFNMNCVDVRDVAEAMISPRRTGEAESDTCSPRRSRSALRKYSGWLMR